MGAQIKKEISIMKMVRHKYVVGMKEVLASRTKIFIVLELVTGGELFDKIVSQGRFSEDLAVFYFNQLVEGVEYCHQLGVCHRDLKPENLLLDEQGNLKISDFGLSALYVGDADGDGASRTQLLHTTCGTPNYVAPEVLADKGYDGKKADVWSCGVILYVLLAGFLPFDETTIVALFAKIQAADFTYPSWFTPEVRSLLDRVLVADPAQRITLSELRHDPWLQREATILPGAPGGDSVFPLVTRAASNLSMGEAAKPPTEDQIQAGIADAVEENVNDNGSTEKNVPKMLNAFDLVNQTGGFALDRLLQRQRADKTSKRIFHFSSSCTPSSRLISHVVDALRDMSCEVIASSEDPLKVRATLLTPKGMIGITVEAFYLTDSLCLLEIRRGKGDILEFHGLLSELIGNQIAGYINNPNPGDFAAK